MPRPSILVMGQADERRELMKHIESHPRCSRIEGVEAASTPPTANSWLMRGVVKSRDRMRPQQ